MALKLTHRIRQDTPACSRLGLWKFETQFATIRVPVKLAGGVDPVVVVLDLDRLADCLFLAERVSEVRAALEAYLLFP
jgi:hypothetical protein